MAQPGTGHGAGPGAPLTDEARRLLDALPTASLLFDAEGRILHVNPSAERLTGFPAADLIARGLDLILAPREAHPIRFRTAIRSFPPPARTERASGPA
ncbi:PAS domain-containing protein [Methylobacterium tardum]|uniref:PAS domain-containing protein n=1 Tax=Methylobacterium tardum TaxID=374432 RepID=UPI003D343F8F